ncbi:hypothetical protein Tco_0523966 [Tanacetum coccineum]
MSMWIISRGVVLLILLMLGISFKFGISGLLHQVITTIADRIRDNETLQSKQNPSNVFFNDIHLQDLDYTKQELLEYMDVHDNDASESSQPSWEGGNVYIQDLIDFDATMSTSRRK